MSMTNIKLDLKGTILTVTIDLSKTHGPSKSGKTTIIASTGGSVAVPGYPEIKLGINAYKPI